MCDVVAFCVIAIGLGMVVQFMSMSLTGFCRTSLLSNWLCGSFEALAAALVSITVVVASDQVGNFGFPQSDRHLHCISIVSLTNIFIS